MAGALRISIGQHSDKGAKESNQDFHGALVPDGSLLKTKGIAAVVADGISTSMHGREAAETAVKSFLSDYYATPEGWSVKHSGERVVSATNAWLYGQTRVSEGRYDHDRGYVSTFTALIFKGRSAHVLHIGDGRLYRLSDGGLTQVTEDHRSHLGGNESVLSRALGITPAVKIDYCSISLAIGDIYLLVTDGMAEQLELGFPSNTFASDVLAGLMAEVPLSDDLDALAQKAISQAIREGANDNLTLQILRVDDLPDAEADDLGALAEKLAVPVDPQPGKELDGWRLLETLHVSDRSRLFKAEDLQTGALVALKVPAGSVSNDSAFLQSFLTEEWVARRLDNPHLMKAACTPDRARKMLYTTFELIEAKTLTAWMAANPQPEMAVVFGLLSDISKGLQAMHRHQMVHQDLRPDNVLVTREGRAVIIDFGSTRILGTGAEVPVSGVGLSTHQYTAPEGLLGSLAEPTFDTYALGVIAYQMLTGSLPYGADMARAASPAAQRKVSYRPASGGTSRVPVWIDAALRKAVHLEPFWRYAEPSEFLADLSRPNPTLPGVRPAAFIARDPVRFWQGVSLCLSLAIIALLYRLSVG
ncbi:bifunctional protein-serine/threonine kinase/phosphatase [Roseibium sp. CAU 1637]|uniref:Bifunctional protein-serine/threonine kinase/phosphatase n=1 Tax=Roseibium limicola TaxID=2816037 RepID=A0A939EMJ0_9HYPH|nr:bifunctional protein-serine/threonine kinase/phosphatase [Roseibium limicola]MBO0345314.1 bifunctional protein-serine/threonine kinase/phosphatase [Roseibium limicola]